MATSEGLEFDLEEDETGHAPEHETYSILAKAGARLEDQMALGDWHLQKLREVDVTEALLVTPMEEEIRRLEARRDAVRAQLKQKRGFHEGALTAWVLDADLRNRVAKTIPFTHGSIATRQTQGKTELAADVIIGLYRVDPKEYGDLVKPVPDTKAVRERYELREDGTNVDRQSGEVLAEPVIVVTEPPTVKVTITATGPGRDVAEALEE